MSAAGAPPDTGGQIFDTSGNLDDRYPANFQPVQPPPDLFTPEPTAPGVADFLNSNPPGQQPSIFSPTPMERQSPQLGTPTADSQTFSTNPLGKAVDQATGMVGMHERVDNADLKAYLSSGGIGMDPAKAAWCAAFVRATANTAGVDLPGATNVATSLLNVGDTITSAPEKGDILVQPRGHRPGETGGHVGLATGNVRQNANGQFEFEMLSGNTGNRVARTWEPARSIQTQRVGGGSPTALPQIDVVAQAQNPQFGNKGYSLDDGLAPFEDMLDFPKQLDVLGNASGATQDLALPANPLADFSTDAVPLFKPKQAIPSAMFDLPTTFTRSPDASQMEGPSPASRINLKGLPMFDSNYDLNNPPVGYTAPATDIPFDERTVGEHADVATRGVRQTLKGLLKSGGAAAYGLPAAPFAALALAGRAIDPSQPNEAEKVYNFFADKIAAANRGAEQISGVGEAQNPLEHVAEIGGESLFPAGKYTAALTGILTGLRLGAEGFVSEAEAAPKRKVDPGFNAPFDGMIVKGNVDASRLGAPINALFVPSGAPDDPAGGSITIVPQSSIYGRTNLPPDAALAQFKRTGINFGTFRDEASARAYVESINDRIQQTMPTIGGPAKVTNGELALMGTMGAISIGAMFAPQVFGMFAKNTPRLGRPVEDAVPGTSAFSTTNDLARTYDDVNAGVLRIARDIIPDKQVMANIQDAFTLQTRGAASNVADSAVNQGRAFTPNFQFSTKTAIGELERAATPEMQTYMHLMDTFDDLMIAQAAQAASKNPSPGTPMIRGFTESGQGLTTDVLPKIAAMEAANPELRQISGVYRQNLRELRRFESTGEYGTMTRAELREANATRPNEVPFVGSGRVLDDPMVQRGSPFAALGEDMRTRMRFRMENEAKGLYVDGMRRAEPDTFVRVYQNDLTRNPTWARNTVTIYRRGNKEMYTTDPYIADVMRMDPYYFQNNLANFAYKTKRLVESTTTGMLAPWFSTTSAIRNHQIIRQTAPTMGIEAPNVLQSAMGIPQQLLPQIARSTARTLDSASGGWLGNVFGQQYLHALSNRLMTVYKDSVLAKLEAAGSHRGSILEHQIQSPSMQHWKRLTQTNNAILDKAIGTAEGATKTFLHGWRSTFGAIHNAPSYALARRNMPAVAAGNLSMPQLAGITRRMTGDPMSGGQYTTGGRPIRFHTNNIMDAIDAGITKGYGAVTEVGRATVPWFNPTMQGIKRIGEAYLDNPRRFVGQAWLYTAMPAMVSYAWNAAAGKDPQGQSYSEYMMNGRSQYNSMMNYYLAIPGRPAHQGIQLPRFHELSPMARMMEIAMDHAFRSNKYNVGDDMKNVVGNTLKVVFEPANPPVFNMGMAMGGMIGPQGVFGGDAYRPRQDPFDQYGGVPSNIEMYARAIAPGIAEIFGTAAASAVQAKSTGDRNSVGAFAETALKRAAGKAPIVRSIFNLEPPASGNTRTMEELMDKNKAIRQLEQFYKQYTTPNLNTDPALPYTKDFRADQKPRSVEGARVAQDRLGNPIPEEIPGMAIKEPTNPLYIRFMDELHEKFKRDDPTNGGMGFQSVWRRFSNSSDAIRTLNRVNAGNFVTWQRQLEDRPEAMAFLKENNVNYKSPSDVKSFYEMIRQNAARELLYAIKSVEHDFTQQLGQPIKLEDLNPYLSGDQVQQGAPEEAGAY